MLKACIAQTICALYFLPVNAAEEIVEPDLTVSKDYGLSRRMTTKLVDDSKLRGLSEADYSLMSLDDPLLQAAYVNVFLQSMGPDIGATLARPEIAAAFNDLKRRGDAAVPLLLKLMQENPYSDFESFAINDVSYIDTIDPKPFLEYARNALETRWDKMNPGFVGRITSLLIHKGDASDIERLHELIKKRPYITHTIEIELQAARRPGGRLYVKDAPASKDDPEFNSIATPIKKEKPGKAVKSPLDNPAQDWGVWLFIFFAAVILGLWWWLRKGSKGQKN